MAVDLDRWLRRQLARLGSDHRRITEGYMIEQLHAAELEEFDRGWLAVIEQTPFATLVTALGGLTRLGKHPASLDRLAGILDRSVPETTALIRENTTARIEDGLIH
jgi:hypothetical protein